MKKPSKQTCTKCGSSGELIHREPFTFLETGTAEVFMWRCERVTSEGLVENYTRCTNCCLNKD